MSLLSKTGVFVLFLLIYFLSMVARSKLSNRNLRDVFRGRATLNPQALALRTARTTEAPSGWRKYLNAQIGVLLFIVPLFLYIYLLSNFFSLPLVILFFAAAQLGLIVNAVLSATLVDLGAAEVGRRVFWTGALLGMANTTVRVWFTVLSLIQLLIAFLVYPVASGIAYFTLPPGELPTTIFQYTLVLMTFGSVPLLFSTGAILASEDLDEQTRTALFVERLGALISFALQLAVMFWAFDTAKTGLGFKIGDVLIVVSLQLLISLTAFFILTTILPYLIGVHRAKKRHVELLNGRRQWLTKLLDILDVPNAARYAPKLEQLRSELRDEEAALTEHKLISFRKGIEEGALDHMLPAEAASTYPTFLEHNPVFSYQTWLGEFARDVEEIVEDLNGRAANAEKERAAEVWARRFHVRKDEQAAEIVSAREAKPPVWIVGSFVVVPLVSAVLGEFAKWLWAVFQSASK